MPTYDVTLSISKPTRSGRDEDFILNKTFESGGDQDAVRQVAEIIGKQIRDPNIDLQTVFPTRRVEPNNYERIYPTWHDVLVLYRKLQKARRQIARLRSER